jgi:uncharacterized protein DUF4153
MTSSNSSGFAARALLAGLAGYLLFHGSAAGINVLLWVLILEGAWFLGRNTARPLQPLERLLLGLLVYFAAAWSWRAADLLHLADAIGLLTAAALLPIAGQPGDPLMRLGIGQTVAAARNLLRRVATGLGPSLLEQRTTVSSGGTRTLLSAGRGVLLSVPLVLVFGALFASADAGFQRLAERVVDLDLKAPLLHGLGILGFAWVAAGVTARPILVGRSPRARRGGLGAIESGLVLGALDLVFLTFVTLQARYFFGGSQVVQATEGLTYAEYAQRGFMELVTVTALVLPLLAGMRARLADVEPAAIRAYRVGGGALIALTLLVVMSAYHRMAIYQREFGLTEQRFYGSAFIGGVAFTLVWFAATVLRERPLHFVSGGLVAWTAWVALLELSNPAAVIADANLRRAMEGKDFDVGYAISLGADAVPALATGLERLPPSYRSELSRRLKHKWSAAPDSGWRAWSLAEQRARRVALALYIEVPSPITPE